MKYRRLGSSALRVSELCLGTMNFGERISETDAADVLNNAVEAGVNFIDTANQYGGARGVGETERILGKWLAEDKARRDRLIIATKVYEPMSDDINDRGLSARHIQMACDASLRRLQVEHIDLYQMHHFDRSARIEEIWQAMDRLISLGKITYVGSSNFPGWAIARANEKASARDRLGLVSEQSLYNLVERRIELEVLPACREYGVGVLAWSPLGGGLLAGASAQANGRRHSATVKRDADRRSAQLGQFGDLCHELGEPPSSVATAWLLHRPGITSAIIGPGDERQLSSLLRAPNIEFNDDVLRRIDAIFPPCGEAPEAYAW